MVVLDDSEARDLCTMPMVSASARSNVSYVLKPKERAKKSEMWMGACEAPSCSSLTLTIL